MQKSIYLILLSLGVLLSACKDDLANAGSSVLDEDDRIVVLADTFSLESDLRMAPNVISSPDSFLVGEIETRFGALRANLLTQLSCPIGYQYPVNAVIDSCILSLYYNTWVGDGNSPLAIDVRCLDKQKLEFNPTSPYLTNLCDSDYCSFEDTTRILSRQHIVVASRYTDSTYNAATGKYIPTIRMRMSDAFCQRFAGITRNKDVLASQEAFDEAFKGLLITSNFGSATILNIGTISMDVYYHFSYRKQGADKDTTVVDIKGFYANSEVRQINRFEYLNDEASLISQLSNKDTSYIIAPAGVYTQLKLPMAAMRNVIINRLGEEKRPYVNRALLRVDVFNHVKKGSNSWLKSAKSVLLMKDNGNANIEQYFMKHGLPSDTLAILSTLTETQDTQGNDIAYYTFDISALLTQELRNTLNLADDTLKMTMIPVSVESTTNNSSTVITSVKQSLIPSATMLRSAHKDADVPTTLKVVYSGF